MNTLEGGLTSRLTPRADVANGRGTTTTHPPRLLHRDRLETCVSHIRTSDPSTGQRVVSSPFLCPFWPGMTSRLYAPPALRHGVDSAESIEIQRRRSPPRRDGEGSAPANDPHTFSSAISKSRMMSRQSSRPMESRTPSGSIPKARFCSSGSAEWVMENGCSMSVLICPRLTARVIV